MDDTTTVETTALDTTDEIVTGAVDTVDTVDTVEEDLLIEEVSIDGMCGVY